MPPPSMTLLAIEPDTTLHFCKTPQQTTPNRMLKLTNLSSGNVAFKVKTTAPKSYLVRPSSGTLRPKESQEVQIILQPQGSGDGQASNHRFLVQAVAVTSAEPVSRDQWMEFQKSSKDGIQEQRLNVVLEENVADGDRALTEPAGWSGAPTDSLSPPADLKVKYDELVQYTLMLEKNKKKLDCDLQALQSSKGSKSVGGGYTNIHLILVAIIAFILSYAAKLVT